METISMNTENSKTNEPLKFVLNLSQRLDLRSSDKNVALQNLSIYYTRRNITQLTFTCSKLLIERLEKRCEICSKLTIKHQNNAIDVALVFLLLTLNIFHTFF